MRKVRACYHTRRRRPGLLVAGREDDVCKLRVGVYGVPQTVTMLKPSWFKSITGPAGHKMHDSQPMMFHRNDGTNHVTVGCHVDDSLGESDSKEMFLKCVADLKREGLESTVNWKPNATWASTFSTVQTAKLLCNRRAILSSYFLPRYDRCQALFHPHGAYVPGARGVPF